MKNPSNVLLIITSCLLGILIGVNLNKQEPQEKTLPLEEKKKSTKLTDVQDITQEKELKDLEEKIITMRKTIVQKMGFINGLHSKLPKGEKVETSFGIDGKNYKYYVTKDTFYLGQVPKKSDTATNLQVFADYMKKGKGAPASIDLFKEKEEELSDLSFDLLGLDTDYDDLFNKISFKHRLHDAKRTPISAFEFGIHSAQNNFDLNTKDLDKFKKRYPFLKKDNISLVDNPIKIYYSEKEGKFISQAYLWFSLNTVPGNYGTMERSIEEFITNEAYSLIHLISGKVAFQLGRFHLRHINLADGQEYLPILNAEDYDIKMEIEEISEIRINLSISYYDISSSAFISGNIHADPIIKSKKSKRYSHRKDQAKKI